MKVSEEMVSARKEQAEKDMPSEVFSVYWILRNDGIENPEKKANMMREVFQRYPHWRKSEAHEREVKREMYKILLDTNAEDVPKLVNEIMRLLKVKQYGE